jgi:hypothetical protein
MNFKLFVEQKDYKAEVYDFKREIDGNEITDAMYIKYKGKKFLLEQFYSNPDVLGKLGVKDPLFIGINVYRFYKNKWVPVVMTRDGSEYIQGAAFYEGFAHKLFRNVPINFYDVLVYALTNEKGRQKLLAKFSLKPSTREHFGDIVAN